MKKIALLIMVITILSKILGFVREIILSYYYGASNISDAYIISITIPGVIFGLIATGVMIGYVPMFSNIKQNEGEAEAYKFTNNLTNILLVLCTIIILFGIIFAYQIVNIFAMGFEGDTFNLAVLFTRISLISIYFIGFISIFSSFLQIKGNYLISAAIGLPSNIIVILSIILSSHISKSVLAIGFVISIVSQLLLMLPFVVKNGYKHKKILELKDKHIINMAYIALPVIIGVSVNQINILVDKTIASQLTVGGISALNYSNKLNGFIQGIFVLSISTVMYPTISKMAAEGNVKDLKKSIAEAINTISLMVIPATIGAMVFAEPIIRLLFGRGAFDQQAMLMTSNALFFYSIGMIGYGLREVLSKVFYSLQDTRTPMINAALAMVMNIILNIILSRYMGIGGLALATSISAVVCTVLLFISLRKKIGPFGVKNISISFMKILCASLVMGVMAKLSFNYLTLVISQNLSLVLAIGIGAIAYFIIIYFMKIEDVDVIVNAIKRKVKIRVSNL